MIIKPLATESALGDVGITTSKLVRVVNTNPTTALPLTVADTTPLSLTIPPNSVEIVEKNYGVPLAGDAALLGTPIAFTS